MSALPSPHFCDVYLFFEPCTYRAQKSEMHCANTEYGLVISRFYNGSCCRQTPYFAFTSLMLHVFLSLELTTDV